MMQSELRAFSLEQQKQHHADHQESCDSKLEDVIKLPTPCTANALKHAAIIYHIHHVSFCLILYFVYDSIINK